MKTDFPEQQPLVSGSGSGSVCGSGSGCGSGSSLQGHKGNAGWQGCVLPGLSLPAPSPGRARSLSFFQGSAERCRCRGVQSVLLLWAREAAGKDPGVDRRACGVSDWGAATEALVRSLGSLVLEKG